MRLQYHPGGDVGPPARGQDVPSRGKTRDEFAGSGWWRVDRAPRYEGSDCHGPYLRHFPLPGRRKRPRQADPFSSEKGREAKRGRRIMEKVLLSYEITGGMEAYLHLYKIQRHGPHGHAAVALRATGDRANHSPDGGSSRLCREPIPTLWEGPVDFVPR